MLDSIELEWTYAALGHLMFDQRYTRDEHVALCQNRGISIERRPQRVDMRRVGSMQVAWVDFARARMKTGARDDSAQKYLLTPPLDRFCDLAKADMHRRWSDQDGLGSLAFWAQPELVGAAREIYQDDDPRSFQAIDQRDLDESQFSEAAQIVSVALDAYLGTGIPDPRFV